MKALDEVGHDCGYIYSSQDICMSINYHALNMFTECYKEQAVSQVKYHSDSVTQLATKGQHHNSHCDTKVLCFENTCYVDFV